MKVNGITLAAALLIGLAVGAFATGRVGGVVLPLLFVLACPLIMMFVLASMSGRDDADRSTGTGEQGEPRRDLGAASAPDRR